MAEKICSNCDKPIADGDKTASGPDGEIHFTCFKRGTAHGREITLESLSAEIGKLKRRVQQLERDVAHHDRNIDFRIGGAS